MGVCVFCVYINGCMCFVYTCICVRRSRVVCFVYLVWDFLLKTFGGFEHIRKKSEPRFLESIHHLGTIRRPSALMTELETRRRECEFEFYTWSFIYDIIIFYLF